MSNRSTKNSAANLNLRMTNAQELATTKINNRFGQSYNHRFPGNQASAAESNFKNTNHISLQRIIDLMPKQPDVILLELINPRFKFDAYLNSDRLGKKLIIQLVSLVEKILECSSMRFKLRQLLGQIAESKFFLTHVNLLINEREKNEYNVELIKSVMKICCQMIDYNAELTVKISSMTDRLELLIRNRLTDVHLLNEFETKLFRQIESAQAKLANERKQNTFKNIDQSNFQPPNDIVEMNIIPKLEDILDDQTPFLRKNITNGAYNNVEHYLDVQFRLLREDYLGPLREGVSKFRSIIREAQKNVRDKQNNLTNELTNEVKSKLKNIESLNVYFNAQLESAVLSDDGILYAIKLDMEKSNSINWENSKKLMFGSMVCFSKDFFINDCLVGVIGQRDLKILKKGLIFVRFNFDLIQTVSKENLPIMNTSYTMIETTAYFESYRHVLEAFVSFKTSNHDDFPFKKHLVECSNTVMPKPNYLKNACIDFRTLVDKGKSVRIIPKSGESTYSFSKSSLYAEKCYLENKNNWPTAQQMNLDASQYEAVQLALESKLALIQGPPGTGKTFIGVKIVQLLLNNKHLWWNKPGEAHRPILMICYTNHALDQFLEYCIRECGLNSGVVRVGGQSKSTNLNPFLLKNIKNQIRREHRLQNNIYTSIRNQKVVLSSVEEDLKHLSNLNECVCTSGLLTFNALKEIVPKNLIDQFEYHFSVHESNANRNDSDYSFLEWLGIFNIDDFSLGNMNLIEKKLNNLTLNTENQDEANGNKENEEDNEFINNERMLEDDYEGNNKIAQYLEERKSDKISKLKNLRKLNFETLIDEEDILEMLIDYNRPRNSKNLKLFIKINEEVNKWTKVKSKKELKEDTESNKSLPRNKFISDYLKILLNTDANLDHLETFDEDIWSLSYHERFGLYRKWLADFLNKQYEKIEELNKKFNIEANVLKELRQQEDISIMKNAHIIAMTTTGSSRYHNALKDIGPRIVIVEEAAEVFEAHIVSSLSKNCEHLILIGDHVQLRPNPAVFTLAKQYKLDVSLFERLINNNTKRVMLNCQHRMRPEISVLMKNFYDKPIIDHESVLSFGNLIGFNGNIFFINHNKPEKNVNDGQSKLNKFEAEFLSELCSYLIKQKYSESQITVLTMYLGQMMEIRKILKKQNFDKIKVSTVDNYQGEENDFILLSLVRSNKDKKIGFLKIDNRVCVSLSRAKKALFCIGDLQMISSESDTWSNIAQTAREMNCLSNSIRLTCGNHPQYDIDASEVSHFKLRPDGGCSLPCGFRLNCGHSCALHCHTFDKKHKDYTCRKNCGKQMKCGHNCGQTCGHVGDCNRCSIKVEKIIKGCGHVIQFKCDSEPDRLDCVQPCPNILDCGHQCFKMCRNIDCYPCIVHINVKPICKHDNTELKIECGDRGNFWKFQMKCNEICNEQLKCGHQCLSNCSYCFGGYIHNSCQEKCDRLLYCGHKCTVPCSKDCMPCQKKCQNKCAHSRCEKKCSEPCAKCLEDCALKCKHNKCSKKCFEPCDIKPCTEPCDELLRCGHPCIGLCGDPCPSWCRLCHRNQVTEIFFGNEDEADARFVQLKDCRHILEATGMDGWINSRYEDIIEEARNKNNSIQFPECPKCKTQIRNTLRYSSIIKKQLNSIEQIKLKQYGDPKQNELTRMKLKREIINFNKQPKLDYQSLKKTLLFELEQKCSYNKLATLLNAWNIFKKLNEIKSNIRLQEDSKEYKFQMNYIDFELKKILSLVFNHDKIINNRSQRVEEIHLDMERVESLANFFCFKNEASKVQPEHHLKVEKLLEDLKSYLYTKVTRYDKVKHLVEEVFLQLKKFIKFELSKAEKAMIVKAMGLSQGHWYKCQNGHVYCIGECGGAMQESSCPDCKVTIGGKNHRLITGNSVATEMDGATLPSWPQ